MTRCWFYRFGRFDVNGYPTIKVFTKGEARDYSGERTAGTAMPASLAWAACTYVSC